MSLARGELVLLSRARRRVRPVSHRLIAGAIDVHLVVYEHHPAEGDVVMLAALVLGELDGVRRLHVIDHRELAVLRAHDGKVRADLLGRDSSLARVARLAALSSLGFVVVWQPLAGFPC